MTADRTTTINKLMELFHESRSRGEWVNLSMESKDGKDSITFSIRNPSGGPEGQTGAWPPSSRPPWTWTPPRTWTPPKRKTPSQWKRDQKRKQEFLAKKVASAEVKKGVNDKVVKATLEDEINLTEIPQLDGADSDQLGEHQGMYSFKSEYGEEDIEYSLSELLPENVTATLVSRERVRPRSADHLCTVVLKLVEGQNFTWPTMKPSDAEVLREIKKI